VLRAFASPRTRSASNSPRCSSSRRSATAAASAKLWVASRTSLLPRQGADRGPEVGGGAGVEAARRFVEQKHAGALDQGARDSQPLIHAAGELHHQRVGLLFEAGIAENFSILCAARLRETSSRAAKNSRFSRAERRGKERALAATAMPTCRRTSPASRRASKPPTRTDPASGSSMVEISLRAVVFPLPFGPSSTRTSARRPKRNVFQGNGFAAPLPAQPIEQSGTMAKYLRTDSKTTRSMTRKRRKSRRKSE
jgi:hypothetical protein